MFEGDCVAFSPERRIVAISADLGIINLMAVAAMQIAHESKDIEHVENESRNSFPVLMLSDAAPSLATTCESSPGRDRTCDQGIMSPLL